MGATAVTTIAISAFSEVRTLPCSFTLDDIEAFVLDAQEFDMQPCLGEDFWEDLIANYNSAPYTTLLARDDYKRALVYFSFARWVKDGYYHSTGSGFFAAQSDFSRQLSKEERDEIYQRNKAKGAAYLERVVDYLNDNTSTYTEWSNTDDCTTNQDCSQTISGIRKVAR